MSGITFGTKQFSDAVQSIRSFAKEESGDSKEFSVPKIEFGTKQFSNAMDTIRQFARGDALPRYVASIKGTKKDGQAGASFRKSNDKAEIEKWFKDIQSDYKTVEKGYIRDTTTGEELKSI